MAVGSDTYQEPETSKAYLRALFKAYLRALFAETIAFLFSVANGADDEAAERAFLP